MREIMELKKVSAGELAELIGVSGSHFTNVIKGRRRFNLKHSKLLIEFFGADLMARAIDWDGIGVEDPTRCDMDRERLEVKHHGGEATVSERAESEYPTDGGSV